jgi:hypothetical protein
LPQFILSLCLAGTGPSLFVNFMKSSVTERLVLLVNTLEFRERVLTLKLGQLDTAVGEHFPDFKRAGPPVLARHDFRTKGQRRADL